MSTERKHRRIRAAQPRPCRTTLPAIIVAAVVASISLDAHASLFQGETLDAVANGASWLVLILAPVVGVTVFWLVHILPEKIAEKKGHPQAKAIQTLCLLSLVFGGLLWPLAWLWAMSKPVFHKMAYGTDVEFHHASEEDVAHAAEPLPPVQEELRRLRARLDQFASGSRLPTTDELNDMRIRLAALEATVPASAVERKG